MKVAATSVNLEGVVKRFGSTLAVDAAHLEVSAGEHLALVGPSGCGKTTLLQIVAGLLAPDEGRVSIGGELVTGGGRWTPPERRGTTMVFQDHALFPHLTTADNVAFGLFRLSSHERRERVEEVLGFVGLADHGDRYPHELSAGQQQRVALARAFAPRPEAVLLDEPFSSLDRGLRNELRAETKRLMHEAGATAVLVTHDQGEAMAFGDRVAVMRAGRIEQIGVPERVFHHPDTRFVAEFLGTAAFIPVSRSDGRLASDAGPVDAPASLRADALTVMARPHEVDFDPDPAGSATITDAEFQGDTVVYTMVLRTGRRMWSKQPHTRSCSLGSRVEPRLVHGHAPALFDGERKIWPTDDSGT